MHIESRVFEPLSYEGIRAEETYRLLLFDVQRRRKERDQDVLFFDAGNEAKIVNSKATLSSNLFKRCKPGGRNRIADAFVSAFILKVLAQQTDRALLLSIQKINVASECESIFVNERSSLHNSQREKRKSAKELSGAFSIVEQFLANQGIPQDASGLLLIHFGYFNNVCCGKVLSHFVASSREDNGALIARGKVVF
jgi:hypothetical protein